MSNLYLNILFPVSLSKIVSKSKLAAACLWAIPVFLNDLVCLNDLPEWMIHGLTHLFYFWVNLFVSMKELKKSFCDSLTNTLVTTYWNINVTCSKFQCCSCTCCIHCFSYYYSYLSMRNKNSNVFFSKQH